MKKHIFILSLALALSLCATAPFCALAQGETQQVQDEEGLLSDTEALDELALEISKKTGVNVCLYISGDCDEMDLKEYADSLYKPLFGDADGIALIHCTRDETWLIAKYGAAKEFITEDAEDELGGAYLLTETFDEGAWAYLYKAEEILDGLSATPVVIAENPGSDEPPEPAATAEEPGSNAPPKTAQTTQEPPQKPKLPDKRLLPRLVDNADLISDEEEGKLLAQLDEISERQQFDVAVVTVDALDGKSPMEYADDFYDYNGYGFGKNHDGILLLVSMQDRDYWISTCGFGLDAFTDGAAERFDERFLPALSGGKYAKAFKNFAKAADKFVTEAKKGTPYDVGHLPKLPLLPANVMLDVLVGFVLSLLLAKRKKAKLKSVRRQVSAQEYTRPGSMALTVSNDRFIRKYTTSRRIEKSSSSSGGGSSSHISSSGRSHGGHGGKF